MGISIATTWLAAMTGVELHFEIKGVVIGAAGVKGRLARGAGIITGQVLRNAQRTVAVAAQDGSGVTLLPTPHGGRMVGKFVMTADASVKRIAALVFDGDNIALGMVVSALRAGVDLDAVDF